MGFFGEALEAVVSLAGQRGKRSMQVQTLLFDRGQWTAGRAKQWASRHGYKHGKVDETGQYIRLRQRDPSEFKVLRTITLGDGIRAVVGR
jgi:hypothetical protein